MYLHGADIRPCASSTKERESSLRQDVCDWSISSFAFIDSNSVHVGHFKLVETR